MARSGGGTGGGGEEAPMSRNTICSEKTEHEKEKRQGRGITTSRAKIATEAGPKLSANTKHGENHDQKSR